MAVCSQILVHIFKKCGCVGGRLVPRLSNRQVGGGGGEPGISRIMNARQFQTRVAPQPQNGGID